MKHTCRINTFVTSSGAQCPPHVPGVPGIDFDDVQLEGIGSRGDGDKNVFLMSDPLPSLDTKTTKNITELVTFLNFTTIPVTKIGPLKLVSL